MMITVAVLTADGLLLADTFLLASLKTEAAAPVLSLYHWIGPGTLQVLTIIIWFFQ